ncbi:hypothetical protein GRX03_01710 [Halovenus sp. WSH3]|uniref:Uncharacterized protein n=1 Tax=Halovenus carboxidivorans TaxID=2692199 RepID=A0A6B0T266_9EURY|nr:hypothetical protein [Halovenus carboxidivorans]MXR50326.1 hypothetical protein [Halovenus carboxidivorans]
MAGLRTQLDGATNILLEEPSIGGGREVCTSLLVDGAAEPNVLFVTFTRQASVCVGQVDDESVGNIGVITVGDASAEIEDSGVVTESVSTPSDLTGLGISIGQFLSEFDDHVSVCFDSLTSMLQYVDVQTAYEFLHAITGQIYAADARAHFHMDPNAHDDQDVAAIASLFDARVTLGDGEPTVHTRELLESEP